MLSQENTTLCQNCEQHIESSKYFLHERMCSQNVKKCPKCNKPYNIDDLNEHIISVHSFTTCELCTIKILNSELKEHIKNCPCKLIPCKYCQLSVLLKELEEHENICGSITQKCSRCGLYIEKRNYARHVCLNKEMEYLNENIKIDNEEELKKEKKMLKKEKKNIKYELEKNTYKKNKNKNICDIEGKNKIIDKFKDLNKIEILENSGNYKENIKKNGTDKNKNQKENDEIDYKNLYTPEEVKDQIKALNRYEKMNYINNNKNKKKKKNKNKEKADKKEEIEKSISEKAKKGKKGKTQKNYKNNKINKDVKDRGYFDDDEYYEGKKKINLHDVKWDIPPDKYKNYNNIENNNYNYNYYNLEEKLVQEAIKLSLKEK